MRAAFLGLAVFALVACDSGEVQSPADRMAGAEAAGQFDPDLVSLKGDGIAAGAEAFYFAAGQAEVETALARTLGEATTSSESPDCGLSTSSYPGGLTVNFRDGNLAGWLLREGAENIELGGGIGIGTPQTVVESSERFARIEGSTLGEEFSLGDNIGGFFENGAVSMLYAGVQCFAR